jgi:adenylate cyclase
MMFPFRYKLSLIISAVALLILGMAFVAVDHEIENEFRLVIEQRLLQAQHVVSQRMDDRFDRLFSQAVTVSDSKLIQDVITDKSLSRVTRDDIVMDEVLPRLILTDMLLVTDEDGVLLASSSETEPFWQQLNKQSTFQSGIDGEEAVGLAVLGNNWLQWVMLPVFIGDQMFGTVILVTRLGEQELQIISQLTGTELLITSDTAYLATGWNDHKTSQGKKSSSSNNFLTFADLVMNSRSVTDQGVDTNEINLQGERYLLRYMLPENPFIPEFVVAQSLDQSLVFVQAIKYVMLTIALIALVIAGALGYIFAYSVSSPIYQLRKATRAIAEEDFSQRVDIRTRDEFRELGESFNQMSVSLAEKEKIRLALDKSVSREVADHLLQQGVHLGGETREATILFADIRDFTSLSEQLTENQLLEMLNEYFTRINVCIQQHNGTIDKFIGDAVMAIFGVPVDDALHACHAVQAAHAMCKAVALFNEEVSSQYGCEITIGIGINTGQIVSGLMGSEDRLNYTVLGDQVNIASRVEGLSKFYGAGIVVTGETRAAVMSQAGQESTIVYRRLDTVQVKGTTVAWIQCK